MLFEHTVKPAWRSIIPAVVHLDGTARLQTINERLEPDVAALLTAFEKLRGVPILCHTSANFHGFGFFPDIRSVMKWGKVAHIWCEGDLYSRDSEAIAK